MRAPYLIRLFPAVAFLASAIVASPVFAMQPGTRDLTIEQRPIAAIVAPVSDFKVTAWVDHKNSIYKVGETLSLFVKSNKDAYITIIDVGTSGKVHMIFPNKYQKDNRVLAHQVLQIPDRDARFRIRVGGPAGTELIKVVATTRKGALIDRTRTSAAGPFRSMKDSTTIVARDLTVELKKRHDAGYATYNKIIRITMQGAEAPPAAVTPLPSSAVTPQPGPAVAPEKIYRQGEASFYGDSGEPDYDTARRLFLKAADEGHVQAMFRIGRMYEQGLGVGKDQHAALNWYRKAAELGNTQAMVRIARIYGRGLGVERDYDLALAWLRKASEAGDGIAMINLAVMYDKGWGVSTDAREASRHLLRAIRAGAWQVQQDVPQFSPPTRQEVQRSLKQAGYYKGRVDGKVGPGTRQALAEYAKAG